MHNNIIFHYVLLSLYKGCLPLVPCPISMLLLYSNVSHVNSRPLLLLTSSPVSLVLSCYLMVSHVVSCPSCHPNSMSTCLIIIVMAVFPCPLMSYKVVYCLLTSSHPPHVLPCPLITLLCAPMPPSNSIFMPCPPPPHVIA